MERPSFEDRVKGCLLGAVIGAELGFAGYVRQQRGQVVQPREISRTKCEPVQDYREEPNRIRFRRATPFIALGVRAYINKGGRVTPEEFADLVKNDEQLAGPVVGWDSIHTSQEILKEGMNPRLSGLGNAPCGIICASMPAVGIYHCGDPEYAYLDGVELASVVQPRLGADWAGLCAAAVAVAFDADATAEAVVHTVLKIAHQNNKELFYRINPMMIQARRLPSEDEFANWWYYVCSRTARQRHESWIALNPISFVLPLLDRFPADPQKTMAFLTGSPNSGDVSITPVVAGAILGALYGADCFPSKWRAWAEPIATPWLAILEVAESRLEKEREIITITERLAEKREDGSSLLFDKIYGCLLAGAIGNAMGSPVEGKFYWEIDELHPDGITTVLDPKRLEGEDDNQMAMLLVETYLKRDGLPVMARHFGRTWRERMNRDHFYPHCMGNAYDLICDGWDARITGHWSVVTGSTVMCMEPVGLYHLADSEYARIDAAAVSYMYQRGLDVTAAVMLAAVVAEALKPEATVDTVCQAALAAAPREKMRTFDERRFESVYDYLTTCFEVADKYDDVMAVRAELYEKCLFYHPIDPLELWGLSLAIFKVADGDARQAAVGGTNIGRDSDTIAGRAAMLAGTLRGAESVPADWVKLFKPETLDRIKHNARRLADLISIRRLDRLARRQAVLLGGGPGATR